MKKSTAYFSPPETAWVIFDLGNLNHKSAIHCKHFTTKKLALEFLAARKEDKKNGKNVTRFVGPYKFIRSL